MTTIYPGHLSDSDVDESKLSKLDQVIRLKTSLTSFATGGAFDGGDDRFMSIKNRLRSSRSIYDLLPDFVRHSSNTHEFWTYIKAEHATYQERREHIRRAFAAVIESLEAEQRGTASASIDAVLTRFDAEAVHDAWEKALARRAADPDGAITAARSLLETVCKHILDDVGASYQPTDGLPKLWHQAATHLQMAPNQQQDQAFKAMLGSCQAVVQSVAQIRNNVGDAHGLGRSAERPAARHAELAVNLAGAMAAFIVDTWNEQRAELEEQF